MAVQPIQLERDWEANHRALRRCHACGAYARPAEQVNGVLRCERCAEKARRERARDRGDADPTKVDFLI
jgi:formylmethanofuran dehydrogenase subunit E